MIGAKIVLWWLTVVVVLYLSGGLSTPQTEDDLLSASFRLKVLNEGGNTSTIIETGRISLFGQSLAEAAGEACDPFLNSKDFTTCVMSIANALRIKRMDILQWVLKIATNRLSASTTTRARDHELLAILRHFDHWDTNVEPSPSSSPSSSSAVSEGRRIVCMLGEDIRPHLLLTFASFTTVRAVHYIFLHGASYESSNPQWGIPFLSSNAMAVIAEKLPPGKVIKATHVTMENDENSPFLQQLTECSVVVLPSDEEVALYPVNVWKLLTMTLRTVSAIHRVPIIWISDTVHTTTSTTITTVTAAAAAPAASDMSCAHCDHPFRDTCQWLLQDTWSIASTILSNTRDGEGFPREQYVWPNHSDSGGRVEQQPPQSQSPSPSPSQSQSQSQSHPAHRLSSVYLGFIDPPPSPVAAIDGATAHRPRPSLHRSLTPTPTTTKETTVVIITFADRIYAETAWGLQQQLREQLHYPHVLLVPQLSLEIWQYVETYLDNWGAFTATTHGPPSSAWSVLQIILTPHVAYGARLVPSSWSKPHQPHHTGPHEVTWQLSYVVVVLEQEWYFRTVQQALVGAVPLLQDAAAVWTFSPVQRDVVRRIYSQQWQEQRREQRQEQRREQRLMDTPPREIEVEVVPIFAPCTPSMPCHIAFEPPSPSPSQPTTQPPHAVVTYELVFFGHDVGGERSRFLATLQPQLAVALPSLRFSPRMPSMIRAHRPTTSEGEEAAAAPAPAAAAVEAKDEDNDDDESLLPLVGRARDVVMLSRSTIALNLRMHALSVLEMHRLAYLLSMGKCIVSQRGRDPSLTSLSMLEGAVYFVDTVDDVVATLQFLLTPIDDTDDTDDTDSDGGSDSEADATSRPLSAKAADWIVRAHGPYQRLARCEQRSLAAYRSIHTLFNQTSTATVMATGDGDESIESPQPQPMYSTVALERAMQRLLSTQRPPRQK